MSDTLETNGSYEVGYGRPPKHSQFRKGCSGNPKGRPKGTRNLKTDLLEELGEQITLSEGGKPKTLSKQRAFLKSLTARAIKGDGPAVNAMLKLMVQVLDLDDEADDTGLTASDEIILENYSSRLLCQSQSKQRTEKPKKRTSKKESRHG